MPWSASEAKSHTKSASTRKKKRQWAKVANSILKKTGNEGRAIRGANAAVGSDAACAAYDAAKIDLWVDAWLEEDRRKTTERDPFGREKAEYEEEDAKAKVRPPSPPDDDDEDDDDDDDLDEEVSDAKSSYAHRSLMEELKRPRDGAAWKDPENAEHVAAYETLARAAHGVHRFSRSQANGMLLELTHARKRIGDEVTDMNEFACKQCSGTGKVDGVDCGACNGTGGGHEFTPSDGLMKVLGDVEEHVQMRIADAFVLDEGANLHYTQDGYLAANPRIARTGIQIYKGDEVGKPKLDRVKVYRPETEVFAPDAVSTYAHLPVTEDHPGVLLTPKNWAKYVKGETGDEILRDGKAVRIPMMLRDHDAIQSFKDGKNQLSVGYVCDLDWTPGRTDDGEQYDCVQRNIRANHLAVVPAARGGPELRIGDGPTDLARGDNTMTLKSVQIDGITVEMSDTAAQVVNQTLARLIAQIDAFKKKEKDRDDDDDAKEEEDAKKDAAMKAKDAQIATLQQQLKDAEMTPVKLDGLVKDRGNVIDKARKAMGSSLVVDGRTVEDIRRQVVEARLGAAANGWDNNQVQASFDTLTAGKASNPVQDAVAAFSRPGFVDVDPRQAAYDEYDREMANAWRGQNQKTA